MSIENFLPYYPIPKNIDFNRQITEKQEFFSLKLKKEPTEIPKGDLLDHQKIISRFLSPHTLYDEILLVHEPGTGKTCSAIGTIENNIQNPDSGIKRALILVKNVELIHTFIQHIINTCTKDKYKPKITDEIDEIEPEKREQWLFNRAKREVRKYYAFATHESFYLKVIKKLPENVLARKYSNCVIVFDEVHNISQSEMYQGYWEFLHLLENRKIMLLTGTPMRNDAEEIIPIMNLILPKAEQLQGDKFYTEMVVNNNLTNKGEDVLTKAFLGRVSYLRSIANIPKQFMGSIVPPLKHTTVFPLAYSSRQWEDYRRVFDADGGWYIKAQEASLFVYPDGSSGAEGYGRYVGVRGNNIRFNQPLLTGSVGEKLDMLYQYSSKYASIINYILSNPKQNVFIFSESITGSGAVILGLCLEYFGITRTTTGKVKSKAPRYAILANTNGNNINIKSVIDAFNRPSNAQGDYIRILIGGRKISEGFTFRNIQQIHVVQPHWNFAVIDQAIARGIRFGSHRNLPTNTKVSIFLYLNYYPNAPVDQLIDMRIYHRAEVKDVLIKQVEYLVKVSSFDCSLTYDKNIVLNGTERDCQFRDCLYKCKGVPEPYDEKKSIDYDTMPLHEPRLDKVVSFLEGVFKETFKISISDLEERSVFTQIELYQGINEIVKYNILLKNKYGFYSFLTQNEHYYYLIPSLYATDIWANYYAKFPTLYKGGDTRERMLTIATEEINADILELSNLSLEEQQEVIPTFPNNVIQMMIESSLLLEPKTPIANWILEHYKEFIFYGGDRVVVLLDKKRELVRGRWLDVEEEEVDSPYQLYGKLHRNKFTIVDYRTIEKTRAKGKNCSSYSKSELIGMLLLLGVEIDPRELPTVEEAMKIISYRQIELKPKDTEELRVIGFFGNKKINQLCDYVQIRLGELKLLV
jgi:hypothetical protein